MRRGQFTSLLYPCFPTPNLRPILLLLAPDFKADSSQGEIKWHEYIEGKWAILFSHPRDFTPVCTTELGVVARLKREWESRGVVVAALSVDSAESHRAWIKDIEEINQTQVWYPIIADEDYAVSLKYGMIDQTHISATGMPFTVRSVYFIGPDKRVKAIITYPASTGRNFNEVLRVIDSLQLTVKHQVATPADWQRGGTCVVLPTIPTDKAKEIFAAGGIQEVRPWLRLTPDPSSVAQKSE